MRTPRVNDSIPVIIMTEFRNLINDGFRDLLENKHLYQNVSLNTSALVDQVKKQFKIKKADDEHQYLRILLPLQKQNWALDLGDVDELSISVPTIKIYCSTCNRIEPFNSYPNKTTEKHVVINYPQKDTGAINHQLFVIEYECQSCKGLPVVFMIQRNNLKLYLVGRYPIESTPVPDVIPKSHRKFISDAIIAHNCGQTLAGLFFLRVFIEQYTKKHSDKKELKADQLIENYMKQLPKDFKNRFPSLSKIYSELSYAIHRADASVKLFDKTIEEMVEHFDAKRLFKIKDKKIMNI